MICWMYGITTKDQVSSQDPLERMQLNDLEFQFKIGDYFSHVTLKFDGWPKKTRGHLFHAT